jgi:thiamine biosynthesis lipoprotein
MIGKQRLLVALATVMIISGCTKKPERFKQTFFRIDTVTDVTIVLPSGKAPEGIWRSVDSLLLDWEERFSVSGPKSEVRVLNERRKQRMPVGSQLSEMIAFSLRYGDSLDGGFDVTILPVKEVWGFGEEASDTVSLPDSAQVDSALTAVSYKRVSLATKGDTIVFADSSSRIDVGGIAKGFVLRELCRLLNRRAIADYLVVAGGDVAGKGRRPDGKPWMIGIRHPRHPDGMIGTLALVSGSVVTSGDYERFRIVDGKRYHHIFSSTTGRSCCGNQSVTVWGMNPIEVDVLSTGLFCRSAEKIVAYIDERPAFQCLVVDSAGQVFTSHGWWGEVMQK